MLSKEGETVSIGLPVFDGADYLERSITSLLNQTWSNLEIIVSDNCSEDATWDVIEFFSKQDSRIRAYRQEENIGAHGNFEYVLNLAKGEYFMWAGCDDWWAPTFVESLVAGLKKRSGFGVAMSSIDRVKEDGTKLDSIIYPALQNESPRQVFRRMVKFDPSPPLHIFVYGVFQTSLIKSLMLRGLADTIAADRILMCEASLSTGFYSTPDILHKRTVRDRPISLRYENEVMAVAWSERTRHIKYFSALLSRLAFSANIPLWRKLREVPWVWVILVSRYFRSFF